MPCRELQLLLADARTDVPAYPARSLERSRCAALSCRDGGRAAGQGNGASSEGGARSLAMAGWGCNCGDWAGTIDACGAAETGNPLGPGAAVALNTRGTSIMD